MNIYMYLQVLTRRYKNPYVSNLKIHLITQISAQTRLSLDISYIYTYHLSPFNSVEILRYQDRLPDVLSAVGGT